MSSSNIAGIVGGSVALFFGAPASFAAGIQTFAQGYTWGSMAGSILDPPKKAGTDGPRLSDLSVQTSTYSAEIPRIYGTCATMGNIFWLENNQLKEVATEHEAEGGGKGGGGGDDVEWTTYAYYATFAVGLCEGPIAGVCRIWVGNKLIYDAGSDDLSSIIANNRATTGFTIYTGSNTQIANSRMQSTLGTADVPGYRGMAYIVFYDYALADHGNSLLGVQVKVEVTNNQSTTHVQNQSLAIYKTGLTDAQVYYSKFVLTEDMVYYMCPTSSYIYWGLPPYYMDVYATNITSTNYKKLRTINIPITKDATHIDYVILHGDYQGTAYFDNLSDSLRFINLKGEYTDTLPQGSFAQCWAYAGSIPHSRSTKVYVDYTHDIIVIFYSQPSSFYYNSYFPIAVFSWSTKEYLWTGICTDEEWNTGVDVINGSIYTWSFITNTNQVYLTKYNIATGNQISRTFMSDSNGVGPMLVMLSDNIFYVFGNGSHYYYVNNILTTVFSNTNYTGGWVTGGEIGGAIYSNGITWETCYSYLSGVVTPCVMPYYFYNTNTDTTLDNIVQAEILKANNISSNDIDVSALTSTNVDGYKISGIRSIRSCIEPLQAAFQFDCVQSGYKIKFVKRGGSSVSSIIENELDAHNDTTIGTKLKITKNPNVGIPSTISVKYLNRSREYDYDEQYAERTSVGTDNLAQVELPIVLSDTNAAKIADILLYTSWQERTEFEFKLPPSKSNIEPMDIVTITLNNGEIYEIRVSEVSYESNGSSVCKGILNKSSTYTSVAVAESGQNIGQTLSLKGPTVGELYNFPCITDTLNDYAYVASMYGYYSAWNGGSIYTSNDNWQTASRIQSFFSACSVGQVLSISNTNPSSTRVDTSSYFSISINKSLSSVTLDQMLNGSNHFAIGVEGRWEIVAAATIGLVGSGEYWLSNMLRGRAGTEVNMNNHAIGDIIVYLSDPNLAIIKTISSNIGTPIKYKLVGKEDSSSNISENSFTYTGTNLECLSPVYLNGSRHPTSNDWTLTWIRRTRVMGEWRDYIDAPVSETSESYEMDIFSDGTYTTIKRTIAVSTPTASYTAAQQLTDFVALQSTLYVKVYQLSSTVGRGTPLTTSITR